MASQVVMAEILPSDTIRANDSRIPNEAKWAQAISQFAPHVAPSSTPNPRLPHRNTAKFAM